MLVGKQNGSNIVRYYPNSRYNTGVLRYTALWPFETSINI